jgi:hypothetical protein
MAPKTRRSANRPAAANRSSVTRSANPAHKKAQTSQNTGRNIQLTLSTLDMNHQCPTPATTNVTAGKRPPNQHSVRRPDTDLTIGSKRRADLTEQEGITTRPSTPSDDTASGRGIPITRQRATKRARIRGEPTLMELKCGTYNPKRTQRCPTTIVGDE